MSRRAAATIPTERRGITPSVNPSTPGLRLGIILDVDPENNTATVSMSDTESTGTMSNVPWLSQVTFPGNGGGLNAYPMRGTPVIVAAPSNQFYVIIGSLHNKIRSGEFTKVRDISYEDSFIEPQEDPENPKYKIKTGNRERVYQTDGDRVKINSGGLSSRDLHLGDVELTSPDSSPARLGVYRGGVIRAKASNLAQILLTSFKGLVRIISRNFQLFSDAGKIESTNKEDVTSLELRFANSFKDETHPSKELWRYRSRIGGETNVTETIVSEPTADDEDGVWDSVTPLFKSTVDKAGAVDINTVETITATATKDVSIESTTANVKINAAINIEETAIAEHKIEALVIKSNATATAEHNASVSHTTQSPVINIGYPTRSSLITINGLFTAMNTMTQFNGPVIITAPIIAFGTTPTIVAEGSSPDSVVRATELINLFNAHTHHTPVGSSSTPAMPLIPSGDLLTTTLLG